MSTTLPVPDTKPLTQKERVDRGDEAIRQARLSLREFARTYSAFLPDPPPARRKRRAR